MSPSRRASWPSRSRRSSKAAAGGTRAGPVVAASVLSGWSLPVEQSPRHSTDFAPSNRSGVGAEAAAVLAAQLAVCHGVPEQGRRRIPACAELEVERALDGQRHVEADDVEQL